MSAAGYTAAAIALSFIGFFGFFLNLFVIIVMWRDKQLWTPLNIILFNLVCSDLSVSIFGNPWTLTSAISHRWIFGRTLCKMYGFFMALLGISSITTLTVLAFERYLIVSKPFRNRGLTRKEAIYLVLGIWTYSMILTTPPLLGWGQYVNEAANISCSVNWEEQTPNAMSYIIYLFIFGLILPLVVIIYSYVNIICTMRKNRLHMGQTAKAEGRVAYMILLMIAAFLIAWAPYAICALVVQFGDASMVSPSAGVFPALLAKSSICYNPIIYVGLNSQFRQALKQIMGNRPGTKESNCETNALGVSKFFTQSTPSTFDGSRANAKCGKQQNSLKEHTHILGSERKKILKIFAVSEGCQHDNMTPV
nr:unnamed protein product [Callosobruchus analis]